MTKRPNVLLIVADQWRGDCLGAAGHPVVSTPTLDRLAARGIQFTRAYSASPTCIPARATLFTGLGPSNTGRTGYAEGIPWHYPTTLAGEFGRQGYQTEAIGKMHVYPERHRAGFDHVRLHDGYLHAARKAHPRLEEVDDYLPWLRERLGADADYFDNGLNCNSVVARPWDKPEHTHPTNWVVHEALRFLDQRDPTSPFLLYLGFHRPHPPYDPPAWAFEQYLDEDLPAPPVGDWADDVLGPWRDDADTQGTVAVYPERVRRRAQAGYYGNMTHLDHQLNRLLEVMQERGVLDNTWICFTSDHGELMGDHHLYRKSLPYEGSARVPLLLVPPRGVVEPRTTGTLAELRDIMPTLLDAAGLEVPPDLDGRSLLEHLADDERVLVGEHPAHGQGVFWVVDRQWKYIWWSGDDREQLFDLSADPQELTDLGRDPGHADQLAALRRRLVDHLAGREDEHSDGERLLPGRPARATLPGVLAAWEAGAAESRQRLR